MAISDKLTYLNTTKTKIREGLNSLGADLDTEDTFRSYADAIDEIYEDYPKITGEGESLSLDNTKQASMKIDYKGNTSQNGTPTPSSPIPINVVSGDNTINICGKNLAQNIKGYVGATYTSGNGECFVFYGNTNQTYRWNCSATTNRTVLAYSGDFPTSGISVERLNEWGKGSTFTATKDGWYIFYVNNALDETIKESFIINKGTTQLPYEPYQGASYSVNLGSLELCKLGDYQDYIYKDNGSWYLHKEIGKVVLNGSETTRYDTTNKTIIYEESNIRNYNAGGIVYCNYYLGTANGGAPNQNLNAWNGNSHNINIKNNDTSTLDDFKTWLSTHNTIVYYVLATPTNIPIEDTTLIEQLEELKLATSYESQTNISQDNNDLPFILDVKALRGE